MGRQSGAGAPVFRFLPSEVTSMEKALEGANGAAPSREAMQALADMFSAAPERVGKMAVQTKQVWNWFQNRRHAVKKGSKSMDKPLISTSPLHDGSFSKRPATTSATVSTGGRESEPPKMEFEAKSSRDTAWYDVQSFSAYRMLESGDLEVRVRFAGFGPEEDEWVNVKIGVRQRSLPCEATECVAVLPGDLILCFQDVERRRHDVRGCRCRFLVQYDHDSVVEIVPLRKVCRRPETEYRLNVKTLESPVDASALVSNELTVIDSK